MADLRLEGKTNQKRKVSALKSPVMATSGANTLWTIPAGSIVDKVVVVVTTADTDATTPASVDVAVGGTVVANAGTSVAGKVNVETTDLAAVVTAKSDVTVSATGAGDGQYYVVVYLVEDNTTGEYVG